jgi:RNA polymerase sigma-70 factor (ECF subfamily)
MNPPPGAGSNRVEEVRDDRALIRAHVEGDPYAFGELVRRHRDRLWAVAVRTLGDREEAADALQDALISAFRNAGSYRGDAAVTTWLHRVVVNACLDRVRRRQARPSVPLGDTEVPYRRDDHSAVEARLDVRAALAALPEPQRTAIVLVDMEDMSVAEAAAVLGVAEGTVKSRCSRGRVALAHLLRGAGPATATLGGRATDGSTATPSPRRSAADGNPATRPRVAPPGGSPVEGPMGPATSGGGGR